MASVGLSSLLNVYQDLAMSEYRNRSMQQMNMANNVMAQQLQNLGTLGGPNGIAGAATNSAPVFQTYMQPSQLRYTVPGSVVRGELDENLNTAEEIAKIEAYAAQKVNLDLMHRSTALLRPVLHGRIVHDTGDDHIRGRIAQLQSKEPKAKPSPKLSLKTTPLFRHLRYRFDSPLAPVSRWFIKWVLSWRYS